MLGVVEVAGIAAVEEASAIVAVEGCMIGLRSCMAAGQPLLAQEAAYDEVDIVLEAAQALDLVHSRPQPEAVEEGQNRTATSD
jgi:hypothetical protein